MIWEERCMMIELVTTGIVKGDCPTWCYPWCPCEGPLCGHRTMCVRSATIRVRPGLDHYDEWTHDVHVSNRCVVVVRYACVRPLYELILGWYTLVVLWYVMIRHEMNDMNVMKVIWWCIWCVAWVHMGDHRRIDCGILDLHPAFVAAHYEYTFNHHPDHLSSTTLRLCYDMMSCLSSHGWPS